jgi:fatty-acyl-CoA synthase
MPLAPMFHSNAWNYPFIAPYIGSKLVLAGRNLQPDKVYELIEAEQVTTLAGVPSLWNILVGWLEANDKRFSRLETMMSAGTNIAPSLVARLQDIYKVDVCNSWGMTEANAATTGMLKSTQQSLPADEQIAFRSMAGRATPGIKIRIVDADSKPLPHDGQSRGELRVKGPWIAASYLNKPTGSALDAHGWLDTGDIATIDPDGYIRIVDRAKDLIKSGGEWISSVGEGRHRGGADDPSARPHRQMVAAGRHRIHRRDADHRHQQDPQGRTSRAVWRLHPAGHRRDDGEDRLTWRGNRDHGAG